MASFEQRGASIRAVVRTPGGGKVSRTFDSQRQADAWAAKMEAHKAAGEHAKVVTAGATCADLFDTFDRRVASKSDSGKWNSLRLSKWQSAPLARLRVADVTTDDINQWIEGRLAESYRGARISPATVNRELNLMSAAFTYAVRSLRWISVNPCHGAHRPPKGKARGRALLSADEIRAIIVATGYDRDPGMVTATARVGACFLLALETGLRSGEILRIRRRHYTRETRTVLVAAEERGGRKGARSGRLSAARRVPLTDEAVRLLDQLAASAEPGADALLARLTDAQRDALWRAARDRSGVPDLHFHDTKHEAATRLARYLDPFELSHAIGTKNIGLIRDTYYITDASASAARLPSALRQPGADSALPARKGEGSTPG